MKQVIKELMYIIINIIMCIIWTFMIFCIVYAPTINKQSINNELIEKMSMNDSGN